MPSLKDLRSRIRSVKNTQQITRTMKMVSAAKVRRARIACENARPYAEKLAGVLANLADGAGEHGPLLLTGREDVKTVRIVAIGSDRGLCAGFNGNLAKKIRNYILKSQAEGKKVEVLILGRKIRDLLKSDFKKSILETIEDAGKNVDFAFAEGIASQQIAAFEKCDADEVVLFYNRFVSMLTQEPRMTKLIPFKPDTMANKEEVISSAVEYEPEEEALLSILLPQNISVQVLNAILESNAAEHAARMAAMESATKNAGDMISRLSLQYNRSRQAAITTELTEIVAGAEAV
jgi:F-type H+-transporting ATPase subunit gamma